MVKIITDSSCMMNKVEAAKINVEVCSLQVTINNQTYEDLENIQTPEFLKIIADGHLPTSSQPSIGKVIETMESYDEDIINITMADGLSGTYLSAVSAKEQCKNKDQITILNSKTLCGPLKHLVKIASTLSNENKTLDEILTTLQQHIDSIGSFLLPSDFQFLKRGGRMTALAATMGGLLKIKPIIRQTPDGKRLDKFHVARTFGAAIDKIIEELHKINFDEKYIIYISHAEASDKLDIAVKKIKEAFPSVAMETLDLSPAMITQGGPQCVAIQYLLK